MSDTIYSNTTPDASDNFVLVAQSAEAGKLLTKRNYKDSQRNYDRVTFFNFFEVNIGSLDELYNLSKKMLDKPNCCFVRARLKDPNHRRNVRRNYKDANATLILENMNWLALDVDWQQESSGDLRKDADLVLVSLPECFSNVECFVVASASYGVKPGIRMRMFFWSRYPVSNADVKRVLTGYETICDPAIFNPIQVIYTAKPIFHGIDDPIKERIAWITPLGIFSSAIEIVTYNEHYRGAKEKWYTKDKAEKFAEKAYLTITELTTGSRHDGIITWGYFLGKLVGQGHFDRDEVIRRMFDACEYWTGQRDTKRDMATITWAVDRGIMSMGGENVE